MINAIGHDKKIYTGMLNNSVKKERKIVKNTNDNFNSYNKNKNVIDEKQKNELIKDNKEREFKPNKYKRKYEINGEEPEKFRSKEEPMKDKKMLGNAYVNVIKLISNCLESIKEEEKDAFCNKSVYKETQSMKKPAFRLTPKKTISSRDVMKYKFLIHSQTVGDKKLETQNQETENNLNTSESGTGFLRADNKKLEKSYRNNISSRNLIQHSNTRKQKINKNIASNYLSIDTNKKRKVSYDDNPINHLLKNQQNQQNENKDINKPKSKFQNKKNMTSHKLPNMIGDSKSESYIGSTFINAENNLMENINKMIIRENIKEKEFKIEELSASDININSNFDEKQDKEKPEQIVKKNTFKVTFNKNYEQKRQNVRRIVTHNDKKNKAILEEIIKNYPNKNKGTDVDVIQTKNSNEYGNSPSFSHPRRKNSFIKNLQKNILTPTSDKSANEIEIFKKKSIRRTSHSIAKRRSSYNSNLTRSRRSKKSKRSRISKKSRISQLSKNRRFSDDSNILTPKTNTRVSKCKDSMLSSNTKYTINSSTKEEKGNTYFTYLLCSKLQDNWLDTIPNNKGEKSSNKKEVLDYVRYKTCKPFKDQEDTNITKVKKGGHISKHKKRGNKKLKNIADIVASRLKSMLKKKNIDKEINRQCGRITEAELMKEINEEREINSKKQKRANNKTLKEVEGKIEVKPNRLCKNNLGRTLIVQDALDIPLQLKNFELLNNRTLEEKKKSKKEKFRKLQHRNQVYDSFDDDEIENEEIDSLFLAPNSKILYILDGLLLLSALVYVVYIPYYLANEKEICREKISFNIVVCYLIDLLYILDIIFGFFRAYYNFEEYLIRKQYNMCMHYLKGWFFLDLIEGIPVFTILKNINNMCNDKEFNFTGSSSFSSSLLLLKSLKIFKVLSHNEATAAISTSLTDNLPDIFENLSSFLLEISIFMVGLHFTACINIFIGRNSYPSWIYKKNLNDANFSAIYVTSMYFVIATLTTVGYGDVVNIGRIGIVFQLALLIIGIVAYSWMISSISSYIKKLNEKTEVYEKRINILEEIKFKHPSMSFELYDKILRHLRYRKYHEQNDKNIIMECLPYSLKNTLIIEMYKNIIENFSFFKNFENSDFIAHVILSFKPILAIKNDVLMQEGDFVEDIIFVKQGVLSLEVCLDMDNIVECCEAYMEDRTYLGPKKKIKNISENLKESILGSKIYANFNNLEAINVRTMKDSQIINGFGDCLNGSSNEFHKIVNIQKIKLLDIRKNEHFGDILMFLNQRSPLSMTVKSKKAELFFLKKIDAIDISTKYPHIWKRINKKSLFNMQQIKKLIKKVIRMFCISNGIKINPIYLKEDENSDNGEETNQNYTNAKVNNTNDYNENYNIDNDDDNDSSNDITSNENGLIHQKKRCSIILESKNEDESAISYPVGSNLEMLSMKKVKSLDKDGMNDYYLRVKSRVKPYESHRSFFDIKSLDKSTKNKNMNNANLSSNGKTSFYADIKREDYYSGLNIKTLPLSSNNVDSKIEDKSYLNSRNSKSMYERKGFKTIFPINNGLESENSVVTLKELIECKKEGSNNIQERISNGISNNNININVNNVNYNVNYNVNDMMINGYYLNTVNLNNLNADNNLTPFKPEEINEEQYPFEDGFEFTTHDSDLFTRNIDTSKEPKTNLEKLAQNLNKKIWIDDSYNERQKEFEREILYSNRETFRNSAFYKIENNEDNKNESRDDEVNNNGKKYKKDYKSNNEKNIEFTQKLQVISTQNNNNNNYINQFNYDFIKKSDTSNNILNSECNNNNNHTSKQSQSFAEKDDKTTKRKFNFESSSDDQEFRSSSEVADEKEKDTLKDKNKYEESNLSTSPSYSFTLNSSYENINQYTNCMFGKSTELQKEIKIFLLTKIGVLKNITSTTIKRINKGKNRKSISYLKQKNSIEKETYYSRNGTYCKRNKKLNKSFDKASSLDKSRISTSNNHNYKRHKSRKEKNKNLNMTSIKPNISSINNLNVLNVSIVSSKKKNSIRKRRDRRSSLPNFMGKTLIKNDLIEKGISMKNNNLMNDNREILNTSNNDYDNDNFFQRMKTNNAPIATKKTFVSPSMGKRTNKNILSVISKNINENSLQVNNPNKFYENFFQNLIMNSPQKHQEKKFSENSSFDSNQKKKRKAIKINCLSTSNHSRDRLPKLKDAMQNFRRKSLFTMSNHDEKNIRFKQEEMMNSIKEINNDDSFLSTYKKIEVDIKKLKNN